MAKRNLIHSFLKLTILLLIFIGLVHANVSSYNVEQVDYEGGVVVTGGYDSYAEEETQTFGMRSLPDLPSGSQGHSLSLVGSILYKCGGRNGASNYLKCTTLNTKYSKPIWTDRFPLSVSMDLHTASVVSDHIWFIYSDMIYDYDTGNKEFTNFSLPYQVENSHCAVSSGSHVYVFGVGHENNEIWVNKYDNDPTDWIQISSTAVQRIDSACLLLNDRVYLTGGYNDDGAVYTMEILDTKDSTLLTGADMPEDRHGHKMFLLDGSPAVIGGGTHDNDVKYDTTFVYDVSSDRWSPDYTTKLSSKMYHFGLVQLPPQ